MTKQEYIAKYIDLCSKICTKTDDYTKSKMKTHNKAMREMIRLDDELYKDIDLAEKVYAELLEIEDMYIQLTVAARCLNLNLHVESAMKTLEFICVKGEKMHSMYAERTLKIWRGEIGPNDSG